MKIFFVVYFKLPYIYHRLTSLKLYVSLKAVHKISKSFYTLLITCICFFKPKKESKKSIKTFLPISKLCLSQKREHFLSSAPIRLIPFHSIVCIPFRILPNTEKLVYATALLVYNDIQPLYILLYL